MPSIYEFSDPVEQRFIDFDKICVMVRRETKTSVSLVIRFVGSQEFQMGSIEQPIIDDIVSAYREYMEQRNAKE